MGILNPGSRPTLRKHAGNARRGHWPLKDPSASHPSYSRIHIQYLDTITYGAVLIRRDGVVWVVPAVSP